MKKEFIRVDLWDKIDIWWTCKRPISSMIGDALLTLHTPDYDKIRKVNKDIYGAVFNCSFEHYTIIKTSYERGFNNIMIFEDDVNFVNDRKYFDLCLSKIPDNYELCKLQHSFSDDLTEYTDTSLPLFSNLTDAYGLQSTAAYCLSRDGMKNMIKSYELRFSVADIAFVYILQTEPKKFYKNNHKIITINNIKSDILK